MLVQRVVVLCVVGVLAAPLCQCKPYRQKRTSDQRLQELHTVLGTQYLGGLVMPLDGPWTNELDPHYLGRRRRSSEVLLQELLDRQEERNREKEEEEDSPRWLYRLADVE